MTLTAIYRVHAAAREALPHPRPGETSNVSEGGACLLLPERLAPGHLPGPSDRRRWEHLISRLAERVAHA